jgi:hypothetical protein
MFTPPSSEAPTNYGLATTEADRQFILKRLDQGFTVDQIADALQHLHYVNLVESIIKRHQAITFMNQRTVRMYHVFAVPAPNTTKTYPRYDQFKVLESDLPAFAKAHGVKESDLLKVSSGDKEQAGSIRQGSILGNLDTRRTTPKTGKQTLWDISKGNPEPMPDLPIGALLPQVVRGHVSERQSAPTFNSPTEWTPPDA